MELTNKVIESLFNIKAQIEYFHWKFGETGSGNQMLVKIDNLLDDLKDVDIKNDERYKNLLEEYNKLEEKLHEERNTRLEKGFEIMKLLLEGKLLGAVKEYKEATGKGLKESKMRIDELIGDINRIEQNKNPDQ